MLSWRYGGFRWFVHGLQHRARYWRARRALKKVRYRTLATVFRARTRLGRALGTSAFFGRLVRLGIVWLATAAAIVALVVWGDDLLRGSSLPFVAELVEQLAGDRVERLLASLAQLSAFLLGLYFTALGVIVSSAYLHASTLIRRLWLNEKVSSRFVAWMTMFSGSTILLYGASVLGARVGAISAAYATLAATLSVWAFVRLATRAFDFLDPGNLFEHVHTELTRAFNRASRTGVLGKEPSLQRYYRKRAETQLRALGALAKHARSSGPHKKGTVDQLNVGALALLESYSSVKRRIPVDSLWFPRLPRYDNWFLTSATSIDSATRAGYTGPSGEVIDRDWCEKKLLQLNAETVRALLDDGELGRAGHLIAASASTSRTLSTYHSAEFAMQHLQVLHADLVDDRELAQPHAGEQETRFKERLALFDALGAVYVDILLGVLDSSESLTPAELDRALDSSAAEVRLPLAARIELSRIAPELAFEKFVEGRTVTPRWFVREAIARSSAEYLWSTIERLVDLVEEVFVRGAEVLSERDDPVPVATLVERGLESVSKFQAHMPTFRTRFTALRQLDRTEDREWPDPPWDEWDRRLKSARENLVLTLARGCLKTLDWPGPPRFPDYFGLAYTLAANECAASLSNKDRTLFGRLFPLVFQSVWIGQDRLIEQVEARPIALRIRTVIQPIFDLIDLSGLALFYTELDGLDYFGIVRGLWDKLLAHSGTAEWIVNVLSTSGIGLDAMHGPRAMERMSWETEAERRLREVVGDVEFPPHRAGVEGVGRVEGLTPLVRVVATSSMRHPGDLFIGLHLANHPNCSDLSLSSNAEFVRRRVAELAAERGEEE